MQFLLVEFNDFPATPWLFTVNRGALTLSEQSIYGSSRLGIYRPALNLSTYSNPKRYIAGIDSGYYSTFTRGIKLFELTNHLGNVLGTITDKKIGVYNGQRRL